MTLQTPYLGAEAAALGDRELASPRVRPAPTRSLSDPVLAELAYAATLFQRAESAIQDEISRLAGVGVILDGSAALGASVALSRLEFHARAAIVKAQEARS